MKILGGLILLWGMFTALSYVPIVVEHTPGLITPPASTVPIQYDVLTDDPGQANEIMQDGCRQIPFWLRAVARYPDETRLVVLDGLAELGEATVDCADGSMSDLKRYKPGRQ